MKKQLGSSLSLLAGLLLSLSIALLALLPHAGSVALFTRLEKQYGLALPEGMKEEFCRDTIAYITGKAQMWNANGILSGTGISASDDFVMHMAEVRHMFTAGELACAVLFGVGILTFLAGVKTWFSGRCWRIGTLIFPGLLLMAGGWCAVDFNGFWYVLHKVFIPGGIFSASETIMVLFPAKLFAGYIVPVIGAYGILLVALLLLPKMLKRKESEA